MEHPSRFPNGSISWGDVSLCNAFRLGQENAYVRQNQRDPWEDAWHAGREDHSHIIKEEDIYGETYSET